MLLLHGLTKQHVASLSRRQQDEEDDYSTEQRSWYLLGHGHQCDAEKEVNGCEQAIGCTEAL